MKSFAQNMKLIKLLLLNLNVVQSEEKTPHAAEHSFFANAALVYN